MVGEIGLRGFLLGGFLWAVSYSVVGYGMVLGGMFFGNG